MNAVRTTRRFDLAVVRHGRTAWNADGRFQGQADVELDDVGRAQAAALRALLAADRFDRAIASDLARARETAEILLADRDVTLDLDPAWREMRFGAWEGLTWAEIVARTPDLATGAEHTPRLYTPDGGESFDALCARVAGAVATLDARAHEGMRALVVTHAGVLHALLRVALGEDDATALGVRFAHASLTRIAFDPGGARLVELNITAPASACA
jgi:broad specificity phosphatase PhoE